MLVIKSKLNELLITSIWVKLSSTSSGSEGLTFSFRPARRIKEPVYPVLKKYSFFTEIVMTHIAVVMRAMMNAIFDFLLK